MRPIMALSVMAMKHWEEWLPEMTAELRAEGRFEAEANRAANRVRKRIRKLMDQGYQEHEAEEVVLRDEILLTPEPEEDEELEELEEEYQALEAEIQKMLEEYDRNNPDPPNDWDGRQEAMSLKDGPEGIGRVRPEQSRSAGGMEKKGILELEGVKEALKGLDALFGGPAVRSDSK